MRATSRRHFLVPFFNWTPEVIHSGLLDKLSDSEDRISLVKSTIFYRLMAKAKCVHHVHNYVVSKGYEVPCGVQRGMGRKCVTLLTPVLTPQTTILRPIHTKRKISLMYELFSLTSCTCFLIFSAFLFAFAWCEQALKPQNVMK